MDGGMLGEAVGVELALPLVLLSPDVHWTQLCVQSSVGGVSQRFFVVLQEGKQASLAADFSITQFRHIGRLLMVHGRNSYKRSAALGQFVMHRGLIISTMQVANQHRLSTGRGCSTVMGGDHWTHWVSFYCNGDGVNVNSSSRVFNLRCSVF